MTVAVFVVSGDDAALVSAAVSELVHRLVAGGDRALMVDDHDGEEYELGAVVDAAQTPPFLTERRVVVARGVGRFGADDVAPLVAWLGDPLPTTDLILATGGGRLPKSLSDAIKRAGVETIDSAPPTKAKDRGSWFEDQVAAAGLRLDAHALNRLNTWLGEDAGRLGGILDTLKSAHGTEHLLRLADVEPFIGEAGGVPPWELTDAIDRSDTPGALRALERMLGGGDRHPLQVMAILHGSYTRLLALDGSGARDEAGAAAAMGIKPGYPARKALEQYRRLGGPKVVRAIGLLAQADLDLRGAKDWPERLVMEVLVARLSRL